MRLYNCGFKNMDMFALCIDLGQKYFASKVSHYFRKKPNWENEHPTLPQCIRSRDFWTPHEKFKKISTMDGKLLQYTVSNQAIAFI